MNKRFSYLVVKYLDHELSEAEKAEFEKYLEDPKCAEYLKKAEFAQKIIDEGFRHLKTERDKMQKEIEEDVARYGSNISKETHEKVRLMHQNMLNHRKKIRLLSYGSVAAAVLIALFFLWPLQQKSSADRLVKKYYKPYDFVAYRSLPETNPVYNKAIVAYKSGKYAASTSLCRDLITAGTALPEYHFLYGLNLAELDSLQSAITHFNTVTSFPIPTDGSLFASVHWYESLCYLRAGKADSALVELNRIRGIDNVFTKEFDVEGLAGGIEEVLK
jgi:hypothetical protein